LLRATASALVATLAVIAAAFPARNTFLYATAAAVVAFAAASAAIIATTFLLYAANSAAVAGASFVIIATRQTNRQIDR
jgi:hypothetical protein